MLTFLSNNWFVICGFTALVVKFGRDQERSIDLRKDVRELQNKYDSLAGDITEIKEGVARIEGRLEGKRPRGNGRFGE